MLTGEIRTNIHRYFISKTDFLSVKDKLSDDQLRVYVAKTIDQLCQENEIAISEEERLLLIREIVGSVVSLGPLRPLLEDKTIAEIMVNGPHRVYVQRGGRIELTSIKFDNSQHLLHTIQKMLAASGSSRRVDESSPYVDFSLNDGSRINVILSPCSLIGPVVTIRKFATDINTIDDLVERKMMNKEMAMLLIASIRAKLNMVFCGATGTGKTTLVNVLSRHISSEERIVTIEDTSELRLLQDHVVGLQARSSNIEGKGAISIRELFINSLRMRPDRIIIGEVRGEEALDMIQAISSGHTGSLAIFHADSPQDCFDRMMTMILMSGIRLASESVRRLIAHAVDIIVHIELGTDGRRRITNITDVVFSKDNPEYPLVDIFQFDQKRMENNQVIGDWVMNKRKPEFYWKFIKRNVALPEGFWEE